jgi:hypothetical protein
MSIEKSNYLTRNRTRNLQVCSIMQRCYSYIALIQAIYLSELLARFCHTTRCHIPEAITLHVMTVQNHTKLVTACKGIKLRSQLWRDVKKARNM